jgi:hypothetical protein
MKILQGFLMAMGALAVLAIIALIVGYVMALLTPDMRANMRPVVLSSEAADSFTKKIDNVKKEAALAESSKTPRTIDIVITEEEVNSILVMMLAEGYLPAKEMLINFNDGYFLTYQAWNLSWFPVKTVVLGQVEIDNGKPKIVVMDFFVGKLPVPKDIDSAAQELLNTLVKLNAPMEELKLQVRQVNITDGTVKITGTTIINK